MTILPYFLNVKKELDHRQKEKSSFYILVEKNILFAPKIIQIFTAIVKKKKDFIKIVVKKKIDNLDFLLEKKTCLDIIFISNKILIYIKFDTYQFS